MTLAIAAIVFVLVNFTAGFVIGISAREVPKEDRLVAAIFVAAYLGIHAACLYLVFARAN